ncbi:glutamate-rich protein 1 [Eublepharis macularius]|uniref:Glutamate-rich protein 1 n=1 Tax=Eublepharis macularius TaxID=481883 RepID=A0AA97JU06_EUBMA|nr:glutamate-rich protein 1 [Eublepharis macularius]
MSGARVVLGAEATSSRRMALSRRAAVFRRKVLEKLFPAPPPDVAISSTEGSSVLQSPVSEQEGSTKASEVSKERMILPPRKMYTVNPPPEDYVPVANSEVNYDNSESKDDNDSNTSEENYQGQPMKKRLRKKRRKKQKNVLQNTDNSHEGQVECGIHENITEDNLQLERADGPALSRNKKRKMKKKRQKAKMRASGLLSKSTAIDFTYRPEREEGTNFEDVDKKADDILDFLQATQELYFSDKLSKCEESSVSSEIIYEILQRLGSHRVASSDITLLHQMKSLVLLQDVERLKGAMEEFQMHSAMPPDDAKAISLLFLYWITDILPGKNRK